MSTPVTIKVGSIALTAQPEALPRLIAQVKATKPMTVRAFRAAQMRKTDKRVYPRFIEGQTTQEYVQAYWRMNGQAHGLVCEYNPRTGESVPFPEEVQRMLATYTPLGTSPQSTPLFDGVEEPLHE